MTCHPFKFQFKQGDQEAHFQHSNFAQNTLSADIMEPLDHQMLQCRVQPEVSNRNIIQYLLVLFFKFDALFANQVPLNSKHVLFLLFFDQCQFTLLICHHFPQMPNLRTIALHDDFYLSILLDEVKSLALFEFLDQILLSFIEFSLKLIYI